MTGTGKTAAASSQSAAVEGSNPKPPPPNRPSVEWLPKWADGRRWELTERGTGRVLGRVIVWSFGLIEAACWGRLGRPLIRLVVANQDFDGLGDGARWVENEALGAGGEVLPATRRRERRQACSS